MSRAAARPCSPHRQCSTRPSPGAPAAAGSGKASWSRLLSHGHAVDAVQPAPCCAACDGLFRRPGGWREHRRGQPARLLLQVAARVVGLPRCAALATPACSAQRHMAPLRSAVRERELARSITAVRGSSTRGPRPDRPRHRGGRLARNARRLRALQANEAQARAARRASAIPSHSQLIHCSLARECIMPCVCSGQHAAAARRPACVRARAQRAPSATACWTC